LEVLVWEILPAPTFGRVRLALRTLRHAPSKRIEDIASLPPIGARVLIRPARQCGGGEFRGKITGHIIDVGDDGERLAAEAEHQLAGGLGQSISNRWQLGVDESVEIERTRVRFNAGRDTFASESLVMVGGRQTRVFDTSATAGRWSVADALGYLIATAVPGDIEVPSLAGLYNLAGNIDLGSLDITGTTAGEAMARVAGRGGLTLRSSRQGKGLIFYRSGREGRRRNVLLQPAGAAFSPAKSNLWCGHVLIRRRPSRRGVLVLGQQKQYESTFQLARGWNPALQTTRWRDFIRNESDNWPAVADVYRKWVLNEHGWYNSSPWNLSTYNFSSISTTSFSQHTSRNFLPCLSTDHSGQSLGVVVETRYGSEDSWRRWTGPVWVSSEECAVYLGGNTLPGSFFQAAAQNNVQLRVTAIVAADARIAVEVPGDQGGIREIIDLSHEAAWRKVHTESIFYGQGALGQPSERDDTQMLERIARRYAEAVSAATEAELTLGWIDTSYHVGDIVERIEGRALELSSNPDRRPAVRSAKHDFGATQSTKLIVSG